MTGGISQNSGRDNLKASLYLYYIYVLVNGNVSV